MASIEPEHETAADMTYEILRDRLALLEIAPNEPINDMQIAAELGTGRTPVREALKRLEQDRLVISYPRRGTFSTTVDITALRQISDIRIQLEPLAATRAAEGASPAARRSLAELAEEAGTIEGDERLLIAMDMRIHRAIYSASGNPFLAQILTRLDAHARRIWCTFLGRIPSAALHMDAHTDLIDAIVGGRAEQAGRITARHVTEFEDSIRKLM